MQWVFARSENFEMYVDREAKRIWRRIAAEFCVEVKVLFEKWKLLFAGLVFQGALRCVSSGHTSVLHYIHGLAARGVHYFHQPGPVLQDLGFKILPEIGRERAYISEYLFGIIFLSFSLWTFHPFVCHSKRFYTVLLWCRVLAFLSAAQLLRILSFYSTQLPGPNYHCREGSQLAKLAPPKSIWEVLLLDFSHGLNFGCGDLIFSSHMIFTLVFVLTYHKYGSNTFIKYFAWLIAVIQSLLIVASRKHYSVDVVVAWYTVNLLVFFLDRQLPEMPERLNGGVQMLPLSMKEKHNRLLNGNSVDAVDWRQRTEHNGKHLEIGS